MGGMAGGEKKLAAVDCARLMPTEGLFGGTIGASLGRAVLEGALEGALDGTLERVASRCEWRVEVEEEPTREYLELEDVHLRADVSHLVL